MLAIVPPNGGPPPHIHQHEDETFYVLDGSPTFRLGDDEVVAGPGDFVNVPKGVVHGFRNASDQPLRMILTFTPAGMERFFEETLERAYDLSQACPDNVAEVGARYAAAAPRFGLQFFL
jgi:mannose-6-phosphate isomerase-like protein (cupin superfamily)